MGVLLHLLEGWSLRNAFRERCAAWDLMTLLAWESARPMEYLLIRQRAWRLSLFGPNGWETTKLSWAWRVALPFSL